MSTLVNCIKKAGALLSKADVEMLKTAHDKYVDAGMPKADAAKRAAEEFVMNAHNIVKGYENEVKLKGGDVGKDAEAFSISSVLASIKRPPLKVSEEINDYNEKRKRKSLEKITEGAESDPVIDDMFDGSISDAIKASERGDIDLGLKDTELTRENVIDKAAEVLGLKSKSPKIPGEVSDVNEAMDEILADVASGELKLTDTQIKGLKEAAEAEIITPLGLKLAAHKMAEPGQGENAADPLTPKEEAAVTASFGKRKTFIERVELALADSLVDSKAKIRQSMVDQFGPFRDIMHDDRSWMLSHLTKSAKGATESLILNGGLFLDSEGVLSVDPDIKGLQDVVKPLGKKLQRWTYYMVGHRAEKLFAEGKERNITEENIQVLKNMNRGDEELFDSVRQEYEKLANNVTQIGVDSGLINAEEAAQWREEGFYVPFNRVIDEKDARGPRIASSPSLARQTAYKQLKGGTHKLDDIMSNVLVNWNHVISASLNNQAGLSAIDFALKMNPPLAKRVTKEEASKDAIFLRRDGKEVWYEVYDPLVLAAFTALNWEGLNSRAMKIGRAFKHAITAGTTASPTFKIANLERDSITAIATTDVSLNIAKNLADGWRATKKGTPTAIAMATSGATFSQSGYIHGSDPIAISRLVKKGVKPETVIDSALKWANVWNRYQEFGARTENLNRAADYVQTLARGEGTLKATFNARDHLDFDRTGSSIWVRAMAQLLPFVNARLLSLDKLARAAPTSKRDLTTKSGAKFAAVVATYSLASIGMYLSVRKDPLYDQLEEWQKRTYHYFRMPGANFLSSLPRPFEVGAIGYIAESLVQQLVDDKVHGELFAERMLHTLMDTFGFNPFIQPVKPILEVGMNKNFFTDRDIEAPYEHISALSPAKRKRAWTSETAIEMAEGIDKLDWDAVKLSPIQIEHLVRGYFGWAGAFVLSSTDMLLTRPLTDSPTQPPMKLTEYPIIKLFAVTEPLRNTQQTASFYETLGEINNAYMDIRDAKKRNDYEEEMRLKADKGHLLDQRKFYEGQQKRLANVNKRMNLIRASKMKPEDKGREIDRLQLFKNSITKQIADLKHVQDKQIEERKNKKDKGK